MTHVSGSALWIFNERGQGAPPSQPNGHNTTAGAQICQPLARWGLSQHTEGIG